MSVKPPHAALEERNKELSERTEVLHVIEKAND